MQYDFGGWATRNNLRCTDGRVILQDAFIDCDGKTVPLVWNHRHGEANNVLGHCLLENRDDGVYCYGVFNNNPEGRGAKELVKHGDITGLSIYANGLKHVNGRNVQHGTIREVSLVLAGANPGAYIDEVICHADGIGSEAIITTGLDFDTVLVHNNSNTNSIASSVAEMVQNATLRHANGETGWDIYNSMNEKQKNLLAAMVMMSYMDKKEEDSKEIKKDDDSKIEHSEVRVMNENKTIGDVYDSLDTDGKIVMDSLIDTVIAHSETIDTLKDIITETGDDTMQHNAFDSNYEADVLMHARQNAAQMFAEAFEDAKSYGSLKESVIAHGIEDIDILFPDAQTINNEIEFVSRNMDWVKVLMDGVHKTPFSRVKSIFADMTDEEARAKGYIKGNLKKEQVFALLKRETSPTTVYKKQKMHRDDLIDIDGRFDIVRYIRKELDLMLREEIARAALIGDGRDGSSEDKINPERIRPIWTDDDFFTIKYDIGEDTGRAFIEGAVKSRSQYKGSGNPILFVTEQKLTELLLLTDAVGRDLFDSVDKLATKLRVSKIVTVPVMEGCIRVDKDANKAWALQGIIVNLNDYNMGTDRGGEIKTFDDFDIDYNAQKYLIETRCSGALTKPFSAIVLETAAEMPVGD